MIFKIATSLALGSIRAAVAVTVIAETVYLISTIGVRYGSIARSDRVFIPANEVACFKYAIKLNHNALFAAHDADDRFRPYQVDATHARFLDHLTRAAIASTGGPVSPSICPSSTPCPPEEPSYYLTLLCTSQIPDEEEVSALENTVIQTGEEMITDHVHAAP